MSTSDAAGLHATRRIGRGTSLGPRMLRATRSMRRATRCRIICCRQSAKSTARQRITGCNPLALTNFPAVPRSNVVHVAKELEVVKQAKPSDIGYVLVVTDVVPRQTRLAILLTPTCLSPPFYEVFTTNLNQLDTCV